MKASSEQNPYVIGVWYPASSDEMIEKYRPLFEDYLNGYFGRIQTPPMKFKVIAVDYDRYSHTDDHIDAGNLDFLFSTAGRIACIEALHQWPVLLSQRVLVGDFETGAQGSVIFSLKANKEISNLTDFRNKRIGIGPIISSSAYHLPYKLLYDNGVHIFTQAAQVIHYANDYEDILNHVLAAQIDGGIIESTWLFENHPEAVDKLLIHRPIQAEHEGEAFPFPTSTRLVPQHGLVARPEVPRKLRDQVVSALRALNGSHPAMQRAGVHRFVPPSTYGFARTVLEDLDLMESHFDIGQCLNPYGDLTVTIACPPNHVRQPEGAVQVQCFRNHLSCPEGLRCDCRPCIPNLEVSVFPAQTVLGLAATLFSLALLLSLGWAVVVEASVFVPARYWAVTTGTLRMRESDGGGAGGLGKGKWSAV